MSKIKLYMFQTGILKCKENNIKINASANPYEIPVPWYFIQHPKGNVVIDGGCAVECAENPEEHWGNITSVYYPIMRKEEGCVIALQQMGIDPASVRYVLQSHLHLDHTGAIGRFPNATHIVQRWEYEYAFSPDWYAAGGYIRKDFDKPNLKWFFLDRELTDEFDLFGDGTIKMIFSPGHSVGHTSFLINLPNSGSLLLAVDAAYTTEHWDEKVLPGFLSSAVDAVRSVSKLKFFAEKTNSLIVTGHDPDMWPTFKRSPSFYD